MAMSKRCTRISNSGLRAIRKHCRQVDFYTLDALEPKDDYERLYNENKVIENVKMTLSCIYQQNPAEKAFLDAQLNPQGDAIIMGMTRELEDLGVIGSETEDYVRIPEVMLGCHVRVDGLRYRIIQCVITSYLEGYPLMYSISLNYDETDNEVKDTVTLYGR